MRESGDQQLVPSGSEKKYLILERQRREMRDVLRPFDQLVQLLIRSVANVCYGVLKPSRHSFIRF